MKVRTCSRKKNVANVHRYWKPEREYAKPSRQSHSKNVATLTHWTTLKMTFYFRQKGNMTLDKTMTLKMTTTFITLTKDDMYHVDICLWN